METIVRRYVPPRCGAGPEDQNAAWRHPRGAFDRTEQPLCKSHIRRDAIFGLGASESHLLAQRLVVEYPSKSHSKNGLSICSGDYMFG